MAASIKRLTVLPILLLAAEVASCLQGPAGPLATEENDAHHFHHYGMRKLLQDVSTRTAAEMKLDKKLIKAASGNAHIGKVTKLLKKGADPDASQFNRTSLHFAAFYKNAKLAEVLIEAGATVGVSDYEGVTPLHSAAVFNAIKVAQVLIDAGADLNAVDNKGDTPLHMAAVRGFVEMAQLLVKEGADVTIKNKKKKKAKKIICRGTIPSIQACTKGSDQDLSLQELLG